MINSSTQIEKTINNIIHDGTNYLIKNANIKAFVVGVSGGIDSALTCALARKIVDHHHIVTLWRGKVKLKGIILPTKSNKEEEEERAVKVCEKYCDEFEINYVTERMLTHFMDFLGFGIDDSHVGKIRKGNVAARLRMIYLYDQARRLGGLVLSTDNKTEFELGFWTLHGDVGDLGLIQNLWKTEVYNIAAYIADDPLRACVEARATDGLGINEGGDLAQLLPGFEGTSREGYEIIDRILTNTKHMLSDNISYVSHFFMNECIGLVTNRREFTKFKRDNPHNINIKREE